MPSVQIAHAYQPITHPGPLPIRLYFLGPLTPHSDLLSRTSHLFLGLTPH